MPVTLRDVLWMLSRPPSTLPGVLIATVDALMVEGPLQIMVGWLALSRRMVPVTVNELDPYVPGGATKFTGAFEVKVPATLKVATLNSPVELNTNDDEIDCEKVVHCTLNRPAIKLVVPLCVMLA